eukprot:gene9376-6595_t
MIRWYSQRERYHPVSITDHQDDGRRLPGVEWKEEALLASHSYHPLNKKCSGTLHSPTIHSQMTMNERHAKEIYQSCICHSRNPRS